jgi:predicted GNAT family acetyltransferase
MKAPDLMIIDHTEVDESLQGQGIGKKLLEQLVLFARTYDIKVVSHCQFANVTFQRMKDWQDVLA